jgi:phage tail sheath gpL-like
VAAANEAPASSVFTSPQQVAKVASYSLAMLAKRAKLKVQAGSKLKATVAAKSKKICRASSDGVVGLAVGKCSMTITATSRSGAKKSKSLTISVKP